MTQASTMNYTKLDVQRDGFVAIVTLNNAPMNSIDLTLAQELSTFCDETATDDSIRVVLFRSNIAGLYSAGADISLLGSIEDEASVAQFKEIAPIFDKLEALPQPTVCAINGTCLGGGFEMALACDFRIMATGSGEVGLPEVRLGLLPGGGGTQRLPRIVGHAVATEMLIKGMRYQAEKALELNLVHKVTDPNSLDEVARKYADSLAKQAPLAVQHIKRLIRISFTAPGTAGLDTERELFLEVARSKDAKEGIDAFFNGRAANFTGE